MISQQQVRDSHSLIIETFKELRAELMSAYGVIAHTGKGDASPVTALDVKVEEAVKRKLLAAFPDFGFKGEETEHVEGTSGATWYVDPIDGTSSFIHGLPYCSNMAALVIDGETVASIIYHFASDELFTAIKGQGAYKNGEHIHIRDTDLGDSYVFTDAYAYKNLYEVYASAGVKFYAPIGATGYFMSRLAQGNIQGVIYTRANVQPHDVAPGILLAQEAGAQVLSLAHNDGFPRQFIVGTNSIYGISDQHKEDILALL